MALPKSKPLSQQIALITGGGSGIGRAFAEGLLAAGVGKVVLASRREPILLATANALSTQFAGLRAIPCSFDIRNRQSTEVLIEKIHADHGSVDILVNNAGMAVPESIENMTESGWDQVLETNLRGAMWLTQLILPKMFSANFGDIVNVSSQAATLLYALSLDRDVDLQDIGMTSRSL